MKKIKKVEFVLENCEVLSIEGKYIGNFRVDNIKSQIIKHYQSIIHMNTCTTFSIAINSGANKSYNAFDEEDFKYNTFDRLTNGDIVSVDFVYDDDTKDSFYVNWVGESDYVNEGQHTCVSELGDLFIVISRDKNIETEFKHWNIDKHGVVNMMWKLD